MCGEKIALISPFHSGSGSPPRVRGKGSGGAKVEAHTGITPACAGKRRHQPFFRLAYRDHPRVCGEKIQVKLKDYNVKGSPPRVRGKDYYILYFRGRCGITPACAGKSHVGFAAHSLRRDHPRVCGEKSSIVPPYSLTSGSPPRVRGKGRRFALYNV